VKLNNSCSVVLQIVSGIESNMVTVIQGSTGSGKTTQVPQYILDHYAKEQRYCNIVVTQPRRIAAMSISRRVCFERNWELGVVCGYQVSSPAQNHDQPIAAPSSIHNSRTRSGASGF
jgi:ATP-dependent RNA helicase TDRD9